MPPSEARSAVARQLEEQAELCRRLGSPLYGFILEHSAADTREGGPLWDALRGHGDDYRGPLGLRLMGAVHRLVLRGRAPRLADHYPSVGGDGDSEAGWHAFRETVLQHGSLIRRLIERPVQTNEVARSAALVGGFLVAAAETGMPLRLLEVGASAGLNLRWDHYRYEAAADWAWGDPSSPVRLVGMFEGRPPFGLSVGVVDREGCDVDPIDPTSEEGRLRLMSYVWADQVERLALLGAAIDVSRQVRAPVERADALDWLARRLRRLPSGVASVAFHSFVAIFMSESERERLRAALERAGGQATAEAPLAWLRMEPTPDMAEVRLTLWPGGEERLLALAGFHGRPVRWLA